MILQRAERQIHDLALKISAVEKEATEQVSWFPNQTLAPFFQTKRGEPS